MVETPSNADGDVLADSSERRRIATQARREGARWESTLKPPVGISQALQTIYPARQDSLLLSELVLVTSVVERATGLFLVGARIHLPLPTANYALVRFLPSNLGIQRIK